MENKHYPESLKIANCAVCTLAEKMKDCNNCAFKCGLQFKTSQVDKTCANDEQSPVSISNLLTTQGV